MSLDGDLRDSAEFAVGFRARWPAEEDLRFFDESYTGDVVVTTSTNVSDIVDAF
jgi:hypothetical protein